MAVKVYVDRLSQPSRAVLIFCKVNGIDFEEVNIDLVKGQHKTPEFKAINPMGQVPAIDDGKLKLFESHAILRYLASAFPGVPDHCILPILSREQKLSRYWTGITPTYGLVQKRWRIGYIGYGLKSSEPHTERTMKKPNHIKDARVDMIKKVARSGDRSHAKTT